VCANVGAAVLSSSNEKQGRRPHKLVRLVDTVMYARIPGFTIKSEKFDDLVAWSDEVREQILNIPGLIIW